MVAICRLPKTVIKSSDRRDYSSSNAASMIVSIIAHKYYSSPTGSVVTRDKIIHPVDSSSLIYASISTNSLPVNS